MIKFVHALVPSLVLVSVVTAQAHPEAAAPTPAANSALQSELHAPRAPKSESTATLLSLGGILVGPTLLVGGLAAGEWMGNDVGKGVMAAGAMLAHGLMIVGPSFGHWYAGEASWLPMGIRVAAGLGMLYGVGRGLECTDFTFHGGATYTDAEQRRCDQGDAILYGSLAVGIAAASMMLLPQGVRRGATMNGRVGR